MEKLAVLPTALKHGLGEDAILYAWDNFVRKRPRGDDRWVVFGFDSAGREIEMVGLVTATGEILIILALGPATEKMKRELGLAR